LNEKTDIYSFAILAWVVLTQNDPFPNYTRMEQFKQFKEAVVKRQERPSLEGVPPELAGLLHSCWQHSQKKRPSADRVLDALKRIRIQMFLQKHCPKAAEIWAEHWIDRDAVGVTGNLLFFLSPSGLSPFLSFLTCAQIF
jgi:hypothetical protein